VESPITGREKFSIEGDGIYSAITGRKIGVIILDSSGGTSGGSSVDVQFCAVTAVDTAAKAATVTGDRRSACPCGLHK
jgi:hypothetical protein